MVSLMKSNAGCTFRALASGLLLERKKGLINKHRTELARRYNNSVQAGYFGGSIGPQVVGCSKL